MPEEKKGVFKRRMRRVEAKGLEAPASLVF